jgi:hypothetical protein
LDRGCTGEGLDAIEDFQEPTLVGGFEPRVIGVQEPALAVFDFQLLQRADQGFAFDNEIDVFLVLIRGVTDRDGFRVASPPGNAKRNTHGKE